MEKSLLNELKQNWRRAKLLAGDHRGMGKNRFRIAKDLGVSALQVFYDAQGGGRDGCRVETQACINGDTYVYSMKDLLSEVEYYLNNKEDIQIVFTANEYNKWGTEITKSRTLFEYSNPLSKSINYNFTR